MKKRVLTVPSSKINEFLNVTGSKDRALAENMLAKYSLDINLAVEEYFTKGNQNKPSFGPSKADIEKEFDNFSKGKEVLEQEEIVAFFEAANIPMDDQLIFVFSLACQAEEMGVFKKSEFIQGMSKLEAKDAKQLGEKAALIKEKYKVGTPGFTELFKFMFSFSSGGKKSIPGSEASSLLEILVGQEYPLAAQLEKYLQENEEAKKESVFKDTWNMILFFLKSVKADGEGYSPEDAWPLLIVNFMEQTLGK